MTAVAIMRLPDRFHVEWCRGDGKWWGIKSFDNAREAFGHVNVRRQRGSKLQWRVVHSQSRVLESEDDA